MYMPPGALPYIYVVVALVLVGTILFLSKLNDQDAIEIVLAVGTIFLLVITVLLFVSNICFSIAPRERFESNTVPIDLDEVARLEAAVCKQMAEVDIFLLSSVGPAGQEPGSTRVAEAQSNARRRANPVTPCNKDPLTPENVLTRIQQMGRTLTLFIEPVLKKTLDATKCEGFEDISMVYTLADIKQLLADYQTTYLDPIHTMQKELQSGIASDCIKAKGASTAATTR